VQKSIASFMEALPPFNCLIKNVSRMIKKDNMLISQISFDGFSMITTKPIPILWLLELTNDL